jgi:hypothetical protein
MKSLRNFLKESLPVVFGVLFALLLNNWKEDLDSRRYVKEYYTHIYEECLENVDDLKSSINDHEQLFLVLEDSKGIDTTFNNILVDVGGLHLVLLKNTSWKYFQSSHIGTVDFEVTSALSEMERMEFYYDKIAERVIDISFQYGRSVKSEDKEEILRYINELIEKEMTLIGIFEAYIEWFESNQKA